MMIAIAELTDDVIQANPDLMRIVDSHRDLLVEMGWGDAPLVEQYAIATTLELAVGSDD